MGAFIALCVILWFVVTFFWWLVAAAGAVVAFYIGRSMVRSRDARRAAARGYCAALVARAEQQHRWVIHGDDRGIYGIEGAKLMREIRR